jgi:hypothetical protein
MARYTLRTVTGLSIHDEARAFCPLSKCIGSVRIPPTWGGKSGTVSRTAHTRRGKAETIESASRHPGVPESRRCGTILRIHAAGPSNCSLRAEPASSSPAHSVARDFQASLPYIAIAWWSFQTTMMSPIPETMCVDTFAGFD